MPCPDAIFAKLAKDAVFSKLDCTKGYWQIAMRECDASASLRLRFRRNGFEADLPSLPVYPVDYRFLTPSTGLPAGRTFLPVFHNIVQIFFSVILSINFCDRKFSIPIQC